MQTFDAPLKNPADFFCWQKMGDSAKESRPTKKTLCFFHEATLFLRSTGYAIPLRQHYKLGFFGSFLESIGQTQGSWAPCQGRQNLS